MVKNPFSIKPFNVVLHADDWNEHAMLLLSLNAMLLLRNVRPAKTQWR
jgi:hypothetical protein